VASAGTASMVTNLRSPAKRKKILVGTTSGTLAAVVSVEDPLRNDVDQGRDGVNSSSGTSGLWGRPLDGRTADSFVASRPTSSHLSR